MSFDAVAPWYRTLEWNAFGDALQRCRVACTDEIPAPRRALIVGEGNGRFICELLRRYPGVEVDCVDASERMLQLARERTERVLPDRAKNVRWLHQDVVSWIPPEHCYDLVVTHFFLDCFAQTELAIVVRKLARASARESAWLLADFRVPVRGMARLHALAWLAVMYRFFRVTAGIEARRLIDPSPFLEGEGFALARQHLFRQGMLKSDIWRRHE